MGPARSVGTSSSHGHRAQHTHVVEEWKNAAALTALLEELAVNPETVINPLLVRSFVDEEFPQMHKRPTSADLDDAVNRQINHETRLFDMGQWVEHLHDDMRWHLEPIARVVGNELIDEDDNIRLEESYKLRSGVLVPHQDVRCPEEALKRAFGMRPWVWQQWAILKLEEHVRFQDYHERDFENLDFSVLPGKLYNSWLDDPRNVEFKALHDAKPEAARLKLREHLMSPFELMNKVSADEGDWNMSEHGNLSVFQYVAFTASGWCMALVVLALQLAVPFLVLVYAMRTSDRFSGGAEYVDARPHPMYVSWDSFCHGIDVRLDTYVMNFLVWIVYAIRVLPHVYQEVYSTLGDAPTVESRLNSQRQIIWEQCDDSLFGQLGFKLERYMKSVYVALVNLSMLFVVFLTNSTIEAILNALALVFIVDFDARFNAPSLT